MGSDCRNCGGKVDTLQLRDGPEITLFECDLPLWLSLVEFVLDMSSILFSSVDRLSCAERDFTRRRKSRRVLFPPPQKCDYHHIGTDAHHGRMVGEGLDQDHLR